MRKSPIMPPTGQDRPPPVEVPLEALSPSALRGVIEAFVLREGTDYGMRDVPLEDKVSAVRAQLERGEARILFDPVTESVDIAVVPQRERRGRRGDDGAGGV
jgi:uncharacterized protein YheU (UPF0270 family)